MQFSVYQESHIGGRKVNQDRMGYSFTRDALLLVLADGMGGHLRGEVAATIALQTISTMFQQQATPYVKKPERFLEQACMAAHQEIHRYCAANNLPDTPRTTVVVCLIQHNTAIWAHVGDSRLYWLRGGQVLARTRDHSHVESLIARGVVPRIELSGRASLLPGDQLLLCSDGLWSMLPDEEMAHCLHTQTVVRAVPDLVSTALAKAGPGSDNVTALAIMWQGGGVIDGIATVTAPDMSTVISTEALPEDLHSTTIHGGAPDKAAVPDVADAADADPALEPDAFNDDEIERAIAEIRGAIEKSSQILK